MNSTIADPDLRVAVVVASVRDGRFGPQIADWVHKNLIELGVDTDVIDLADLTFPQSLVDHPDVASFAARIDNADGVVVVTPEYNHSYPGPLKNAIDAVSAHWRAKPVAFVSYGGLAGGLRAVEALRIVLSGLHAVTLGDTVSLHNPWGPAADPDVEYPDRTSTEALHRLVHRLSWWAQALRTATQRVPFPA